jgi:hypothetical protein
MISVSLKTLLLYNFGIALVFLVVGALSVYSLDLVKPGRATESAAFSKTAQSAIEEEPVIENVRARALFYFSAARDIRRARLNDEVSVYYDLRVLSLVVAGLFAIGGLLGLLLLVTPRQRERGLED